MWLKYHIFEVFQAMVIPCITDLVINPVLSCSKAVPNGSVEPRQTLLVDHLRGEAQKHHAVVHVHVWLDEVQPEIYISLGVRQNHWL